MSRSRQVQKIRKNGDRNRTKFDHAWKSCARKDRYDEFEARRRARERGLRCYHCQLCECWHLTKGEE